MERYYQALIALFFPLWISGCGAAPFVTDNLAIKSPDDLQIISICYHANATTREEVTAFAVKKCKEEGSTVTFLHHDKMFNDCPILAKMRVSFICVSPVALAK